MPYDLALAPGFFYLALEVAHILFRIVPALALGRLLILVAEPVPELVVYG